MTDVVAGHQGHIQAAERRGLAGAMPRPVQVTMLGAGSMFTPELVKDLFLIPDNVGGTIALVDIDEPRLATMAELVGRLAEEFGVADRWRVVASVDRCEVLAGTDYLVNCIEVSGVDCVGFDNDIPARYGVDQCIGDTIGPGGVFKGLRTIPVWLEVLADVERLCPGRAGPQLHEPDEHDVSRRRSDVASRRRRVVSLRAGDEPGVGRSCGDPLAGTHVGVRGHQPSRLVHATRTSRGGSLPAAHRTGAAGPRRRPRGTVGRG